MPARLASRCIAAAVLAAPAGFLAATVTSPKGAERIELSAKKYEFSAAEIRVRKGRPVTLVMTASDFVHGFSVPDLKVRTDLVPGKAVELTFTPDRAGRFVFLCDNFCGDAHDRMTGYLVVTE